MAAQSERVRILQLIAAREITVEDGSRLLSAQQSRSEGGPIDKPIDEMSGLEFEDFIKRLYDARKFTDVRKTPVNDQGADLLCLAPAGEKAVVQTKRWRKKASNRGVQEAIAAMSFYKAQLAFVVTNSDFTRSARELARADGRVTLVDGRELNTWLQESFPVSMVDKPGIEQSPQPAATIAATRLQNLPYHASSQRYAKRRHRHPEPRVVIKTKEEVNPISFWGWIVAAVLAIILWSAWSKQSAYNKNIEAARVIMGTNKR